MLVTHIARHLIARRAKQIARVAGTKKPPRVAGRFEQVQCAVLDAQFSFRFDTGASNWAISAVCGALPLKVSTLPSDEIATLSPSLTSPARIISASGSWTGRWITRLSGRAPSAGSQPLAASQ